MLFFIPKEASHAKCGPRIPAKFQPDQGKNCPQGAGRLQGRTKEATGFSPAVPVIHRKTASRRGKCGSLNSFQKFPEKILSVELLQKFPEKFPEAGNFSVQM